MWCASSPGMFPGGGGEQQLLMRPSAPCLRSLWLSDKAVTQRWCFGRWSPGAYWPGRRKNPSNWPCCFPSLWD